MNILKALAACKEEGLRVRPVSWRTLNRDHWVEFRHGHFIEVGTFEEIPHALRLSLPCEFLDEWEVMPS